MQCKCCGDTNLDNFAPFMIRDKRHWCRECTKKRMRAFRGDNAENIALRILFNLKQRCRTQGRPEGAVWTVEDVQKLLDDFSDPTVLRMRQEGINVRFRIVPINEDEVLLPGNAMLVPFGV